VERGTRGVQQAILETSCPVDDQNWVRWKRSQQGEGLREAGRAGKGTWGGEASSKKKKKCRTIEQGKQAHQHKKEGGGRLYSDKMQERKLGERKRNHFKEQEKSPFTIFGKQVVDAKYWKKDVL